MQKENIHTDQAPGAIGPYVQAVKVGELIYTAGQGGLDPVTGTLVEGGVQAQTEQAMENLSAVLEAAGSDLDHVVKTNIFLRYIRDFDAMNEVYASFFEGTLPARTTVATSALPMAALVEIEMVALAIESEAEETEVAEVAEAVEETEVTAETQESKPKKKKKPKAKKPSKGKKKSKKKKK
jgi:2-iminobutanoate/2-iminopropanoate deaminase